MKLQDSMGKKLIPLVFKFLEPGNEDVSFIDTLNKLEKMQVLSNVEEWLEFRSLRNELSHEYPDQLDSTVENLNILYEKIPGFLAIYDHFIASAANQKSIQD